jgi:regulator of protease activity HflC (stomatin/prohibitin superfamily)
MSYRSTESKGTPVLAIAGTVIGGLMLLILAVVGISSVEKIDSTEHCVLTRFGTVTNPKVETGPEIVLLSNLTCFPLTQQQFPGGSVRGEESAGETVEFLTRDSIMMKANIAILWKYTNVGSAFETRRAHDAVLSELSNSVRAGSRDAGATIGLTDLMGAKRAGLDEVFRTAINERMSDYATIEKVYIREVQIPQNIQSLWTATLSQQAKQAEARAAYITDSLNARRTVIVAQASAEATRLTAQAMAVSPAVLKFRSDSVMAAGMKEICGRATTCIVGGNVADKFFAGINPR